MNSQRPATITAVVNTYNAEEHLDRVLRALEGFDELLVCDMQSQDQTLSIARRHGCRIVTFERGAHTIVEPAREYAIRQARSEWVLVVDADEIVTPELRDHLCRQARRQDLDGLYIARQNFFMGRFLHSAYPDHCLRFFRREKTHWPPVIHCSPEVSGHVERLPAGQRQLAFVHLANDSVASILRKANTYSDHELPRRRHKGYGLWALLSRPAFRFFKSYILKRGFLDGMPGLIHAMLDALYQFVVVAKLIEERH